MHIILMVLIGITTTQPAILDQTDEEWTASGYTVVEEVSINPFDYGEPISWGENSNGPTASIGCQGFFVPTENGEKWRIIMLLKDKIVVLQEDEEVREISLACDPINITFSPNGCYALVKGRDVSRRLDRREVEYINIDTGEIRLFEPALTSGWIGGFFINNDGSLYRFSLRKNVLEYYDPDLNLISSHEGDIGYWGSSFSHASDGSIIILAFGKNILAFDSECNLLWRMESENQPHFSSPVVSPDGSYALLSTHNEDGLTCLNAHTGEVLWSEMGSEINAPLPSDYGNGWAARLSNRGLLIGTDVDSRESINYVLYPSETWSYGSPVAVARNGACLLKTVSLSPEYQNVSLIKFIYTDETGNIIWVSAAYSAAAGSLDFSANINIGRGLEFKVVKGIQSDGNRFIYSDYEFVKVLRVEGGE